MLANSSPLNKRTISIIIVTGVLIGVLFFAMSYIQSESEKKINKILELHEFESQEDYAERISPEISLIIEQQKFSTFMLILSLTAATGFVIFFFERFKIKEAEQSDSKLMAIGELSARLAHDLRNPLSIIRITLENLKMLYGEDETKTRQFQKIDRAIDRIVHQIDEVLGFVRESPLNFHKESVLQILKEVKDSTRIPEDISLVLPNKDVKIYCDKSQLIVALNNLLYNSIQAINGKGMIAISLIENNKKIILEIEDSGLGIPEEILPKIFDPLFTTKQQGTGLGLVSVKSIIESHGGTISVTSPPTIFTIVLPKNQN